MDREIVVVAGGLSTGRVSLEKLAAEFGWSLKHLPHLADLEVLRADSRVVAVLFSPANLAVSWKRALHKIQESAPQARPILCHRFRDSIDWPRAAKAGVFLLLPMPLSEVEVRQSLGFVWSARANNRARKAASAQSAGGQTWPDRAA